MNPWWLLLIVPVAMVAGVIVGALIVHACLVIGFMNIWR